MTLMTAPRLLAPTGRNVVSGVYRWINYSSEGLDHRAGHFRPLRITAYVLEPIVLSTVRCFCVVQKPQGVAGAMIEAAVSIEEP